MCVISRSREDQRRRVVDPAWAPGSRAICAAVTRLARASDRPLCLGAQKLRPRQCSPAPWPYTHPTVTCVM